MHWFKFDIKAYASHTAHLSEMEDLAYRRMMDWCYLHEEPLPLELDRIAKLIRMRTHSECIADVLQEFWIEEEDGYYHAKINDDIAKYRSKSDKAKAAAEARWNKKSLKNKALGKKKTSNADAMQTHSERNANKESVIKNNKSFVKPTLDQVTDYFKQKGEAAFPARSEAEKFMDHYTANGWKVGRNSMRDWKAAVRNWMKNVGHYGNNKSNNVVQEDWAKLPSIDPHNVKKVDWKNLLDHLKQHEIFNDLPRPVKGDSFHEYRLTVEAFIRRKQGV